MFNPASIHAPKIPWRLQATPALLKLGTATEALPNAIKKKQNPTKRRNPRSFFFILLPPSFIKWNFPSNLALNGNSMRQASPVLPIALCRHDMSGGLAMSRKRFWKIVFSLESVAMPLSRARGAIFRPGVLHPPRRAVALANTLKSLIMGPWPRSIKSWC